MAACKCSSLHLTNPCISTNHALQPLQINEVVKMAPVRRQTMLFSATMTEEVKKLVALSLKHPVRWDPLLSNICWPVACSPCAASVAAIGKAASRKVPGTECVVLQPSATLFRALAAECCCPPLLPSFPGWRQTRQQQPPRS